MTEQDTQVTYDPYATIVINTHQPVYAGVTTKLLEAHEVTSLFNNKELQSNRLTKLTTQIENVREYLIENYDQLGTDADNIALLLDIDLVQTVEVEISATLVATVEVPIGYDVNDIDTYDLNFTVESNNNDIEVSDYDISYVSVRES